MKTSNTIKFAAAAFVTNEFLQYAFEEMCLMHEIKLRGELGIDSANRHTKNKLEKQLKARMEAYVKKSNLLSKTLIGLSSLFEETKKPDHKKVFDYSIDKLTRSLDNFTINEALSMHQDKVKSHIFDSLDSIKSKERSEEESTRLIAAYNNFLTVNKLK